MKLLRKDQVFALFLIIGSAFLALSYNATQAKATAMQPAPVVIEQQEETLQDIADVVAQFQADNNPGHIKKGNQWLGEAKCEQPSAFECFTAPEWGTRAMARLLRNYQEKYGLNTIADLVEKWAPASDGNNPEIYAEGVAVLLGVDPQESYDVENVQNLGALMAAMIYFEGSYSKTTIRDIVNGIRLENSLRKFKGYVPRNFGQVAEESTNDRVML